METFQFGRERTLKAVAESGTQEQKVSFAIHKTGRLTRKA